MAAAAGGGGNGDVNRDGAKNVSNTELRKILQGLPKNTPRSIELTIHVDNGRKQYTTIIQVIDETDEPGINMITMINPCIEVIADDTFIRANTPERACFEPTLESEPIETPNRITTTDVLQVLKTKLMLAYKPDAEPVLLDGAKIQGIPITTFRLLRGQRPIYEKYGYKNNKSDELQTIVEWLQNTTWGDVAKLHTGFSEYTPTFEDIYKQMKGSSMPMDTPLIDVMRTVTLDMEVQTADPRSKFFFSNTLLSKLLLKKYREKREMNPNVNVNTLLNNSILHVYQYYTLDSKSAEWKHWSDRITITNAELLPPDAKANKPKYWTLGGKRRLSKKVPTRRQKKRRARKTKRRVTK
jgi:hypothetical protein